MTYHCSCGASFTNWPAMHDHALACDEHDNERLKLEVETFIRTLAAMPGAGNIPETFPLVRWGGTQRKVWCQFQIIRKDGTVGALLKVTLPQGAFNAWRRREALV